MSSGGLVRMEDVSSHQMVLRSLRIRRTLHAGASGRALLSVMRIRIDKQGEKNRSKYYCSSDCSKIDISSTHVSSWKADPD